MPPLTEPLPISSSLMTGEPDHVGLSAHGSRRRPAVRPAACVPVALVTPGPIKADCFAGPGVSETPGLFRWVGS